MNKRKYSNCVQQLRLKTEEVTEKQAEKQTLAVKKAFKLLRQKNGVMLADDVGMGKTFEALSLVFLEAYCKMKYLNGKRVPRVLVIVPSTALKIKWEKDVQKFFQKCVKKDKFADIIRRELSKPLVIYRKEDFYYAREKLIICSIYALFDNPIHRQWDVIIIDECHKFKNKCTKRYALFDNSEREDIEPILRRKFEKLILMTATPFQLRPNEIISLLGLILSARWKSRKAHDKLKSELNSLKDALNEYQVKVGTFERSWKDIPYTEELEIEQLSKSGPTIVETIKMKLQDQSTSNYLKRVLNLFLEARSLKDKLEGSLATFVVRNSKPREYRREIVGSLLPDGTNSTIKLTSDEELFYLLVNKFLFEINKERRTFTVQVLQETTSSYVTLNRYSISSLKKTSKLVRKNRVIRHYRDMLTKAIELFQKAGEHPKIRELKINLRLRSRNDSKLGTLPAEKTLIFCRFIETAKVIRDKINEECRRIIKDDIPQEIRDAFRKKYPRRIFLKSGKPKIVKVWRFSKRFENLLKRGHSDISALLDSLYDANPNFKRKIRDKAKFRVYTKRQGARRYWYLEIMKKELEDVIKRKLREEGFLHLIMERYQDKTRGRSLKRREKTRIMKEALEEVFKEKLFPYLKHEITHIERDFYSLSEEDVASKIIRLINGLRRQDFAEALSGNTKSVLQGRLIEAFNTKFNPMILIVTQIGQEGIDLQKECSRVIHYDLWWNPAVMEQRVGRIDRIGSKISRERGLKLEVYTPFIRGTVDEHIFKIVRQRKKWFELIIGSRYAKESQLFSEKIEKEASFIPLPDSMYGLLKINLEPS